MICPFCKRELPPIKRPGALGLVRNPKGANGGAIKKAKAA